MNRTRREWQERKTHIRQRLKTKAGVLKPGWQNHLQFDRMSGHSRTGTIRPITGKTELVHKLYSGGKWGMRSRWVGQSQVTGSGEKVWEHLASGWGNHSSGKLKRSEVLAERSRLDKSPRTQNRNCDRKQVNERGSDFSSTVLFRNCRRRFQLQSVRESREKLSWKQRWSVTN